jgi:hypothetical protein
MGEQVTASKKADDKNWISLNDTLEDNDESKDFGAAPDLAAFKPKSSSYRKETLKDTHPYNCGGQGGSDKKR